MGLPVIVYGDRTDHGGTVISGDVTAVIEGKPIARLGDQVSCPKCNGVFEIIEGVVDTIFTDRPVALHGHKTACGAVLIGSQTLFLVHTEPGNYRSAPAPVKATKSSPVASAFVATNAADEAEDKAASFNYQFAATDSLTGVPLARQPYRLKVGSKVYTGKTDENGLTQLVTTGQAATEVVLEILAVDEIVNHA